MSNFKPIQPRVDFDSNLDMAEGEGSEVHRQLGSGSEQGAFDQLDRETQSEAHKQGGAPAKDQAPGRDGIIVNKLHRRMSYVKACINVI